MNVEEMIAKVFNFNGKTLEDWKKLDNEIAEWRKTASDADKFKFKCSGAGEMLSIMICCYDE